MHKSLKRRVYELVEVVDDQGRAHYDWFDRFLVVLILLNVAAVMLETVQPLGRRYGPFFAAFETFSVAVFTIEYALRIWSCTADPAFAHPVKGRLRYAVRPLAIVDLLAILPAFLPLLHLDLRFLRAARLLRLLRVFKLAHYSESVGVLTRVLRSKRGDLTVMAVMLCIVLVLSAGVMYYAERARQPEAFSSIPAALWWAVVTLTTIGYGDVYPITPIGRIIGGVIAVAGVGIVALPTAVIASGFAEEVQRRRSKKSRRGNRPPTCPHCGKEIHGSESEEERS